MKRAVFLLLSLFCLSASAQIFNQKLVLDKFDDVISSQKIKTLIQKHEKSFVIEEKGKKPVTYVVLFDVEEPSWGNKDNIVNLVNDVYGYQEGWVTVLERDMEKYMVEINKLRLVEDSESQKKMLAEIINKYSYSIFHRVVTKKYTHDFVTQLYWISKGEDNSNGRTIYEIWE